MGGVVVESQGSSSILQLFNVTWKSSGRYTCEEVSSDQSRHVDVFVVGQGNNHVRPPVSLSLSIPSSVLFTPSLDPDEWFVPVGPGVVMKEAQEDTIPCVVSDPQLNVSLYERPSRTLVKDMMYEPGRGFTGRLNDTSYVCVAARGTEQRESQVYYVFSLVGERILQIRINFTKHDVGLDPVFVSVSQSLSSWRWTCLCPAVC